MKTATNGDVVQNGASFVGLDYKGRCMQVTSEIASILQSIFETRDCNCFQQGAKQVEDILEKAWKDRKANPELYRRTCDFIRESGHLDELVNVFTENDPNWWLAAGNLLEACLSQENVRYLVQRSQMRRIVDVLNRLSCSVEGNARLGLSILGAFLQESRQCVTDISNSGGLQFLFECCSKPFGTDTLLKAARSLSNIVVFGNMAILQKMVSMGAQEWLFLLSSKPDPRLGYYACLAGCFLVGSKTLEVKVESSGLLEMTSKFLRENDAQAVAQMDLKQRWCATGIEFLKEVVGMLKSDCKESQAMAAFQLTMEAYARSTNERKQVFTQLNGVVEALTLLASCPLNPLGAGIAAKALQVLNEPVPKRLLPNVPQWTSEDVHMWVSVIGFDRYADRFLELAVDGDILLQINDFILKEDFGLKTNVERMRFIRELNLLKVRADYSSIDPTGLDILLMTLDKALSVYTFQLLLKGVTKHSLLELTSESLRKEFGIDNTVHLNMIKKITADANHVRELEVSVLKSQTDIFISYRRSSGSQLASLLKVLLTLQGFKVFIDIDKLYAGQFAETIMNTIRASKHFILILSPGTLDRCIGDDAGGDWIHKELLEAIKQRKNIIPVRERDFQYPDAALLPEDIRTVGDYNEVEWVHEYQSACLSKLLKFLDRDAEHFGRKTPSTQTSHSGNSTLTCGQPRNALRSGSVTPNSSTEQTVTRI